MIRFKARARGVAPVAFAGLLVMLVAAGMAGSVMRVEMAGDGVTGTPAAASSDPVITVNGNAELAAVPGILGNGTAGNPYIIENMRQEASPPNLGRDNLQTS